MSKAAVLMYRTSRIRAGLTQSRAAEQLHIAEGTISNYENGKAPVPHDIVDLMCQIYRDELLAYWHLQNKDLLGRKYLPPITLIHSGGELAFQSLIAKQRLEPVVGAIMSIMSDGVIHVGEADTWDNAVTVLADITGKLFSILLSAKKMEKEKAPATAGTVKSACSELQNLFVG